MAKQHKLWTPDMITKDDIKNGKIYLGIPRERVLINMFVDNRDSLLMALQDSGRGHGYFQADGHRVDRNRDAIVKEYMGLADTPPWLMMIDSDMEHPREAPMRLTRWGKPVVGALYFHRGKMHDPFVFEYNGKGEDRWGRQTDRWAPMRDEVYEFFKEHNVPMRDGALVIDKPVSDPLMQVDAVATGCMLIHRSVFECMEPPWFEYRTGRNSEDLEFCKRVIDDHGVPIHADLSTICGHYHWVPMGQAQFRTLYEARGINLTTYSLADAADMLSVHQGMKLKEATERMKAGSAHMTGDYFKAKYPGKTVEKLSTEELQEFYKDTYVGYLYLIELLYWNHAAFFDQLRRLLIPLREMNVLEIGAGIGTVSIQLTVQRNEVVASEVNSQLRGFIKMRWDVLKPQMVGKYGELYILDQEWRTESEDEQFHAVVAFDVFEHLAKDDLQAIMRDVYRVQPIGGRLIYHANWSQQDLYPTHFNHEAWWGDFMQELGYVQMGNFEATKVR